MYDRRTVNSFAQFRLRKDIDSEEVDILIKCSTFTNFLNY